MNIRKATLNDIDQIWPIFQEIVTRGDTYAIPRDTTKAEAITIWLETPKLTYVIEEANRILGTYYLKTNQPGPGDHVCNCGYMVSSIARGRGLGTELCKHSQQVAMESGYKAMQFNFVASSNEDAVNL